MVTFELAVGTLSAVVVTALLAWGIGLVALQARCHDTAAQIARQLARGDQAAAQEALARGPQDASMTVDDKDGNVSVVVRVAARFGAVGPVDVRGGAQMPREQR